MRATLGAILEVLLIVWLLGQCRKPTGLIGRGYVAIMNQSHAALTDWAVALLAVKPNSVALDIGCGGGRMIQQLAALAPEGTVHGIDYSAASIAAARSRNAREIAAGRVVVERGSVAALPYPDHTFDIVTAVETHYYWPDLPGNLREVRRVLRPGGTFALVAETHRGGTHGGVYALVMRLIRAKFLTAEEHERLLTEAGFVSISLHRVPVANWLCVMGNAPGAAIELERVLVLARLSIHP